MTTFVTKDASNNDKHFDFDGVGDTASPFVPSSRILLGAINEPPAASPSANSGLNGLFKGLWQTIINRLFGEFAPTAVTVGTSLTTVIDIDCRQYNSLSIEVSNSTGAALAQCQVQARYHSASGVWNPKTFGAAEYTTGTGKQSGNSRISIIEASGDLNVLAINSSGWVEIDCSRYAGIRLQTRTASGTTSVTCRAIAK